MKCVLFQTARFQFIGALVLIVMESLKCSDIATIAIIGDISFAGIVYKNVKNGHCTYNESFVSVKNEFKRVDHIIGNFECPIGDVENPPKPLLKSKKVHLIAERDSIQALNYLNVSVVALANNHLMDFKELINPTMSSIKNANIQYSGITLTSSITAKQKPVILHSNNVSIGVLSYCANVEGCTMIRNKSEIGVAIVVNYTFAAEEAKELKKSVDVVIGIFHWGDEYAVLPEKGSFLKIANFLNPHFDVVVGMHQHVISGHFYFKGTLFVLGLGNFLFPMHLTPAYKFNVFRKPKKSTEKFWYRLSKKYKNTSAFGKILKLNFNKNGLIKNKSFYENVVVDVSKKKCLYTKRKPNSSWQVLCNKDDEDCLGTSKCNPVFCGGTE